MCQGGSQQTWVHWPRSWTGAGGGGETRNALQLALDIHAPVQDAHDLDSASPARPVEQHERTGM